MSLTHMGSEGELDKHITAWSHCQECIKAWNEGLYNTGEILGFYPSQWSFPSTHCISEAAATPWVQLHFPQLTTPIFSPEFPSPLNGHLEVIVCFYGTGVVLLSSHFTKPESLVSRPSR